MLRAFFIYLSESDLIRRMVTRWRLPRRVAARFVAGDTLAEAMDAVEEVNNRGLLATLDHLGERVSDLKDAERAAQDYLDLIDRIEERGLKAGISLKLTQLGLEVDYQACLANLRSIVTRGSAHSIFVRIDMEHSAIVEETLRLYDDLRAEGLENVGVVIQSYLYRSRKDVEALLEVDAPIRLVKGAYDEPADIAFPRKDDVDTEFDVLARLMIENAAESGAKPVSVDGRTPPLVALGTHDEVRINAARDHASSMGFPREALEVQLLFGIRVELGQELAAAGYPLRVYVPYGTEWYPYFMRRLAERPANLWFFISNLLRG